MSSFLTNAQGLFDVAMSARGGDRTDIALLIRPDGGLHMVMETPFALGALAAENGARVAYRVTRSAAGVTVTGQQDDRTCVLRGGAGSFQKTALRDQPLYNMTSPVLISAADPATDASWRAKRGDAASIIPQSM